MDFSKVEDVSTLTDDQLLEYEKWLEEGGLQGESEEEVEAGETPPDIDPAEGDLVELEEDVDDGTQGSDEPTPESGADDQAADDPDTADNKLAGKFETPDDLIKGVENEVQALGLDPELFRSVIEVARESEDFTSVEALYRKLGAEVTKRQQATEPQPDPKPQIVPDKELINRVTQQSHHALRTSELAQEMQAAGIKFPESIQELQEMRVDQPYWALKYETALKAKFNESMDFIAQYRANEAKVDSWNETARKQAKAEIEAMLAKHKVTYKPEEIDAFIKEAERDQAVYEDRTGVNFLKKGALVGKYIQEKVVSGTMLDQIVKEAETRGRAEALSKRRVPHSTISRTPGNRGPRTEKRAVIDLNDPSTVEHMTDTEIENLYRHGSVRGRKAMG